MACSFRSLSWSTGTLCTGCCVGAVTGGGQKRLLTRRVTISPISMKLIKPNTIRKGREKAIPPEWKPGEFGGRGALGGMPLPAYSPQACVHAMFSGFRLDRPSAASGRQPSRARRCSRSFRSPEPYHDGHDPAIAARLFDWIHLEVIRVKKVPRRKLKMLIYWDDFFRGAGEV